MSGILKADEHGHITGAQHQQWTSVFEIMKATLAQAGRLRNRHVDAHAPVSSVGPDGQPTEVPFFVHFEMQAMLEQINRHRTAHAQPAVSLADVALVERRACGHSDYASKYALYCADLVCFGPGPRT